MESPGHVTRKKRAAFLFTWLPFFLLLFAVSCKSKHPQMEQRLSVKGILLDTAGRPVPNAVVMIADGSHEFNDMASVTNDSGEFYLSNVVVPGRYVLQIEDNSGTKTKEVNLTDTSSIRLTL
jgi:hypothetical protein